MKKFTKVLCFLLSIFTIISCIAACGRNNDETTELSNIDDSGDMVRDSIKDDVPADLRFDGETVTFFVRDDTSLWKNEMDVEKTTNDTLYDAIYYRNATVEQRLGVEITQISQLCGNGEAWNASLRNSVLTKSNDYEAAAIYASSGSALAVEGLYYNLLDMPHINLNQPWWNKSVVEEVTLFDTLYFLAGDIAISEAASGTCLFFNKNLFNELYGAQNINLYEIVEQQEWTIDRMNELVSAAWQDIDSDGLTSEEDIVGLAANNNTKGDGGMDAWVPALGVSITKMVDGYPELTFYDEHTVDAFEKLCALYNNNPGTLRLDDVGNTMFLEGQQLFIRTNLDSGSIFRGMSDDYGVLPLPKCNSEQEDYHTNFLNVASLIVVLSTCEEVSKVGATLELMAAESYKQVTPAYFEICLKGKYADAPEDAKMYDIILDSFEYSFGYCYSTHSLGAIGSLFRHLDADIAQKYEQNKIMYETKLEELITKLDDISFNMD